MRYLDHRGLISFPFFERFGSVHAARLKTARSALPALHLRDADSTRRWRVLAFRVAFTHRTHSQRAIGVMFFHSSWISSGAAARGACA
jgi:hypothetical protein